MKMVYEPEQIDYFVYRAKQEDQPNEPVIQPSIELVHDDSPHYLATLTVALPLERCFVSGEVTQVSRPMNASELDELTTEQTHELLSKLFTMIQRLTYEVTEITLDEPGIDLVFSPTDDAI